MKNQSRQEFCGKICIKYMLKIHELRVKLSKEKDRDKIKRGKRILEKYVENVAWWTVQTLADIRQNGHDQKAMQVLTQIVLSKGMIRKNVLN